MAGSSYSTQHASGSGSGSGYSTSAPVQTPQSDWSLTLSKMLSALGQNQYNWAMQQFNEGKGVTNENINQYLQLAGKGAGLAQDLLGRYKDTFEPLMDQFIQQAGTYGSENRQRFMAGQAESTVAQADQHARDEAERKLQGFGINPNSGRYQDLMLTSRIQDAAARAGAGTQASLNTADRGRQMLQQAAQMGQNVPGMTVNALQSAYTGLTGAENAILGMLNTGANVTGSAAPFLNTAGGAIKLPTNATNAKNQNQNQNQSAGRSVSAQSDPSKGSGGDKGQRQPQQQGESGGDKNAGRTPPPGSTPINPKMIQNPNPGILKPKDDGTGDKDKGDYSPYPMVGTPEAQPYFDQNGVITPMGDPNLARDGSGQLQTPDTAQWDGPQAPNWQLPQDTPDFGVQGGPSGGGNNVENNAPAPSSWNPSNIMDNPQTPQPQNQSDPWGGQDFSQQGDPQDVTGSIPQQQDFQSPDYGGGNNWQPQDDNQQGDQQSPDYGGGDYSRQQQTAGGDYQQQNLNDSGDYGEYARGGRVRSRGQRGVLPTTGGNVSRQMSPSRGRQTDDVPARLNAGEFVMPRDVVAHKGSEFFQNLIKKSRMARTGASGPPARGRMKPSLPNMGRPAFVSRHMGA